jgi:hypothetical protein
MMSRPGPARHVSTPGRRPRSPLDTGCWGPGMGSESPHVRGASCARPLDGGGERADEDSATGPLPAVTRVGA